jgi:trk system potassium uptake protein
MARISGPVTRFPARALLIWYLGLILVGSSLLRAPWSWGNPEKPISWSDATFTATSAACVTGLTVRSTGDDYSLLGQITILVLIQLGGIGIMTVTTLVTLQLGGRCGLRERVLIRETLGVGEGADLRMVIARVIGMTLGIELFGASLLFARFAQDMPLVDAIWNSVFHSISAYCNAGFGLRNDNLVAYRDSPTVNLTICLMIIVGGLGVPVLSDLQRKLRDRRSQLRLHTKLTVAVSLTLLALGTAMTAALEWDRTLRDVPTITKFLAPLQHSTSCRTAGFNTLDLAQMSSATLFLSIVLMLIGGGAGSTAGGMKVTTFGMLLAHAWSRMRGRSHVNLFRRTIPSETIERSFAIAMLYVVVAAALLALLLIVDQRQIQAGSSNPFLSALFEVVSALGTVGLSMGLTGQLSDAGRIVIIMAMFIGRLGPFTAFAAAAAATRNRTIQYASEEPLLG